MKSLFKQHEEGRLESDKNDGRWYGTQGIIIFHGLSCGVDIMQFSIQDLQVYNSWLEHSHHNVTCWLSHDFIGAQKSRANTIGRTCKAARFVPLKTQVYCFICSWLGYKLYKSAHNILSNSSHFVDLHYVHILLLWTTLLQDILGSYHPVFPMMDGFIGKKYLYQDICMHY